MLKILIIAIGLAWLDGGGIKEPSERVDLIEVNHHHDELGRHCYDQAILRRWSPDYRRYEVCGWKLLERLDAYPTRSNGFYRASWISRDYNVSVTSELMIETWSVGVDPEREAKKLTEEKHREGLVNWAVKPLRSILEKW